MVLHLFKKPEDGSAYSDQNPIHERNSGTFLVIYVGNGTDGLGKKENSMLLSYHVLFPTSDSGMPSECMLAVSCVGYETKGT